MKWMGRRAGGSLLEDDSARLRTEATGLRTNQQARFKARSGMSSLEKERLEQCKGQGPETGYQMTGAQVTGTPRMDMLSARSALGGQAIHSLPIRILPPITGLSSLMGDIDIDSKLNK